MRYKSRLKEHSEDILKDSKVASMGPASAFSDPLKPKDISNVKIEYDEEYNSYLFYCTPKFLSIDEAIREFELKL